MAEDNNDDGGKDPVTGHYTGPGPKNLGRPLGSRNLDNAKIVRDAIIDSFHKNDGVEILARLALEKPEAYMKCVLAALPREDVLELLSDQRRTLTVVISKEPAVRDTFALVERCMSICGNRTLTKEHVGQAIALESEEQNRNNRKLLESDGETEGPIDVGN